MKKNRAIHKTLFIFKEFRTTTEQIEKFVEDQQKLVRELNVNYTMEKPSLISDLVKLANEMNELQNVLLKTKLKVIHLFLIIKSVRCRKTR